MYASHLSYYEVEGIAVMSLQAKKPAKRLTTVRFKPLEDYSIGLHDADKKRYCYYFDR